MSLDMAMSRRLVAQVMSSAVYLVALGSVIRHQLSFKVSYWLRYPNVGKRRP